MPLTREQTKYVSTNDTVFLPTVAVDLNLGVRGTSVFDGPVRFNGQINLGGSTGTAGYLLSSTGTGVQWITPPSVSTLTAPVTIQSTTGVSLFLFQNDLNGNLEIGRIDGIASTPYIDFHSGATAVDYDARIIASGGFGVAGQGALTINGNLVQNVNATAKIAAYQLTTADANTIVQMNGAFAFQVDTSLAVLPLGTTITLVAQTAGVTVATTATATVPTVNATPGLKLRAAWSTASLIKMSAASASGTASTWLLTGDLTA